MVVVTVGAIVAVIYKRYLKAAYAGVADLATCHLSVPVLLEFQKTSSVGLVRDLPVHSFWYRIEAQLFLGSFNHPDQDIGGTVIQKDLSCMQKDQCRSQGIGDETRGHFCMLNTKFNHYT